MASRRVARPNVQKSAAARAKADAESQAATQARWDAVLAGQLSLPFDGTDAELVTGYTRVQQQLAERREARAMASRCTCQHSRAEHTGTRLVCAVRGCSCVRYRS